MNAFVGECRLSQPLRHTAVRPDHRLLSPERPSSAASAKLDFTNPLRPVTSVSPGPGRRGRVACGPTLRKPSTWTAAKWTSGARSTSGVNPTAVWSAFLPRRHGRKGVLTGPRSEHHAGERIVHRRVGVESSGQQVMESALRLVHRTPSLSSMQDGGAAHL